MLSRYVKNVFIPRDRRYSRRKKNKDVYPTAFIITYLVSDHFIGSMNRCNLINVNSYIYSCIAVQRMSI